MFLDYFTAPVDPEGFEAELLVFFHSACHSLLLLIPEISLRHNNDVFCVKLSSRHFDLDNRFVPLGVPKDVLMQKQISKHKGLIPDSMLRRASRFDLTIDKGDNSNTLVPTTAMRPDVTAKRYSHGTREFVEYLMKSSKVDAKIDVKTLCMIDWIVFLHRY